MKTEKKKTPTIIAAFTIFLLITATAFGESSPVPDFKQETPIAKLPTPVDFSTLVYAETSKIVEVGFYQVFDKESQDSKDPVRRFCRVDVEPAAWNDKKSYKIKCDFEQQTATVTSDFLDFNDHPIETLDAFKIIDRGVNSVCLMRIESSGGYVHVITMDGDVGSFMETFSNAPGGFSNTTVRQFGTAHARISDKEKSPL